MIQRMSNLSQDECTAPHKSRGATATEYAMLVALLVGATLVAIDGLTTTSGSYFSSTGDDIGEPRERIADMDPDLPDPPDWLP